VFHRSKELSNTPDEMTLLFDTREPDPHPWARHLPEGWCIVRGTLETGDIALARIPEGVVIERKTPHDLVGCIGASRERFERELRRGRYVGRFLIVVEGSLEDVQRAARGIHPNSIIGTLAAWAVRFCPIIFAGSTAGAAEFAFRALAAQVRDIQRDAQSLREEPSAPITLPTQQTRHSGRTARKQPVMP
jgi:ERCC4-type nuclease